MSKVNTYDDFKVVNQRSERIISLLAAFLGLTLTVWANMLMGVRQGPLATVLFFVVGIPTYSLCMGAYNLYLLTQYRRKYIRQRI